MIRSFSYNTEGPPERRVARGLLVANSAMACLGAAVASGLVWAQFRSFDLLDGAYYFLVYEHPGDDPDTHTRFQFLARPIWLLCRRNIVAFRLVCLAIMTVACWVFWRALRRHLPSSGAAALMFLPLWLATMAGVTWVPVALTYNSLATIFSLLGVATLLMSVGAAPKLPLTHGRLLFIAALLFVLIIGLYFVKPPAAAAFFACSYLLLWARPGIRVWHRRLLGWVAVSAIAAAAETLIILVNKPAFGQDKLYYFGGLKMTPSWLVATLERYAGEIRGMLPSLGHDLFWTIVPILFACCAVLFERSTTDIARRRLSAALGLMLAALFGALIQRRLWQGSFAVAVSGEAARFYLLLWCSLLPIWIVCKLRRPRQSPESSPLPVAWVIIFFSLPLISSFGSTNTPYVSALHETVLWAAGLLLLAEQIGAALTLPWFRSAIAALLCLGAFGHIFSGHFLRPYMWQPSLWKQSEPIEIGNPPTIIKVDPALAAFLRKVRGVLDESGYRSGDDVFGFFNLPGLIFVLGAREPGAPWYFGTWYHQNDTDGGKLRLVPLERRHNAWIITQADVAQFRAQFLESGIDFPDGYRMIGKTINPTTGLEIGIWKPLARH